MSKNIVKPRTVSFEEALRNLASRLTGTQAAELPRTQEAIVQYMAENAPAFFAGSIDLDELAEAVAGKVIAYIAESTGAIPADSRNDDASGTRADANPKQKPKQSRKDD